MTVTGNVYTDPERLQAVVDDLVGTPVLVADTQQAERELEAIPWVDDAKVTTHFPHGVHDRDPRAPAVATYQGPDGQFRVIDRDGRVLDVLDGVPDRLHADHRSRPGRPRPGRVRPAGLRGGGRAGPEPHRYRARSGRAASTSPPTARGS